MFKFMLKIFVRYNFSRNSIYFGTMKAERITDTSRNLIRFVEIIHELSKRIAFSLMVKYSRITLLLIVGTNG